MEREHSGGFVGVLLPKAFYAEFRTLNIDLQQIAPSLRVRDPAIAHISLFYLNSHNNGEVEQAVSEYLYMLEGKWVVVRGMGVFRQENQPKVLYLPVSYPWRLVEFNRLLRQVAYPPIHPNNSYSFSPHITVSRLNSAARNALPNKREEIEERMNQFYCTFPLSEVAIFQKSPQSPFMFEDPKVFKIAA